ncbi:hypothetical protein [Nocardia yamanashiensis]|uniref:hypothetical protein n=1 Tax=Nocardia yamanashiensis TaxID=209247 RepID=UPI00082E091C|nr:hypothetical protein [Nocardia yamanashiensis]
MDVIDPETARGAPVSGTPDGWGRKLRLFRHTQLGLSRGDFAELVNEQARRQGLNVACSERHIARWELGEVRRPNTTYRDLLAALGAPSPDTAYPPSAAETIAELDPASTAWLSAPGDGTRSGAATFIESLAAAVVGSPDHLIRWLPPASAGGSNGEQTHHDLDFVRDATARLREIDQRHGGSAVATAATGLLTSTTTQLIHCRDEDREHALLIACADLARLVGWAHHDIGDQHQARGYAALALFFARKAGADSLAASILYVLGRISLFERDPHTALRMFQLGQLPAQVATGSGESARLYANEAWAHAMLGDAHRMRWALSRAEDEIDRVGDALDPWTQVFFTPGEYTGMRSVIYSEYAATTSGRTAERHTLEAIDTARTSLMTAAPGRPTRSILFDNITVATGAFRLGQIDDAMTFATASLALTHEVDSGRAIERLGRMAHTAALASPRADVRDLCEAVRHTLTAAAHRIRTPRPKPLPAGRE